MNPNQRHSTNQLIEALDDVCQTINRPSPDHYPTDPSDSGYGSSYSSVSSNSNDALERFVQKVDEGAFTAAENSLSYLLTIDENRIKNYLDPLQFDKNKFKEILTGPISDEEMLSSPTEEHDGIKGLHESLQTYGVLLLNRKFHRSQTEKGDLGHKRHQYLDQINSFLFKQVPTLYSVLAWSYRFSDNQQLYQLLSCLEGVGEKASAVIAQLSIADYRSPPFQTLLRLQAKIWRDVSSDGVNHGLKELVQQHGHDEDTNAKYLSDPDFDPQEIKLHCRADILLNTLIDKQSPQYRAAVAGWLFPPNNLNTTMLNILEGDRIRDHDDSTQRDGGRYGHDKKVVDSVLRTIVGRPKETQDLLFNRWKLSDEIMSRMAQMSSSSAHALSTGRASDGPCYRTEAPPPVVKNPF